MPARPLIVVAVIAVVAGCKPGGQNGAQASGASAMGSPPPTQPPPTAILAGFYPSTPAWSQGAPSTPTGILQGFFPSTPAWNPLQNARASIVSNGTVALPSTSATTPNAASPNAAPPNVAMPLANNDTMPAGATRTVPSGATNSGNPDSAQTVVRPSTMTPDSLTRPNGSTTGLRARMADSLIIADVMWRLTQLDGVAIENASGGQTPSLQINADGGTLRAMGNSGCNRFAGPVSQNGNQIRFGALAATKMACPAMQLESRYFAALQAARTFRMTSRQLDLMAGDRVVARFSAP